MAVKSGAKITLMVEEPNSLSVCQLPSTVSHPGYFSVDQFFDRGFYQAVLLDFMGGFYLSFSLHARLARWMIQIWSSHML